MADHAELVRRFVVALEARDWETWTSLLSAEVVYEIPQTRERIRGRDRYLAFNQAYPGDWHLTAKVVLADDTHGVVWFDWTVGDEHADGMAFFEFDDGLISRVTDFWPESYEPPDHRPDFVERW
jgi:hypothetical protein